MTEEQLYQLRRAQLLLSIFGHLAVAHKNGDSVPVGDVIERVKEYRSIEVLPSDVQLHWTFNEFCDWGEKTS